MESSSYAEGRRCSICGSLITDDNPDGIGFGCRENVFKPAKKEMFNLVMWLEVWKRKVEVVRAVFIQTYAGRKFRKQFKADFYKSMCDAERVSKKQLEIMTNWLSFDQIHVDTYKGVVDVLYDNFNPYYASAPDGKTFDSVLSSYKNQYLSKRNKSEPDV